MNLPFTWPAALWVLLLVPLLVFVYRFALRRRPRTSVAYPDGELLSAAAASGNPFRRHLPAALFLAGLTAILTAVARPQAPLRVPADQSAIMLAIDVSGSMRSQDVLPNRLAAAQEAAKVFIGSVPASVRIGLVSFGGYATLHAPPGTDRPRLIEAIDNFRFIQRTAIGEGLLEAVAALPGRGRPGPDGTLPPMPSGPKPPGVVILLSDGRSNTGIDPHTAADIARRQEVTVYTVGVGQTVTPGSAWTIGGPLDEEELQTIARETGGTYYHASSTAGLRNVYRRLARAVGWEWRTEEVTGLVGMLGGVAVILAVVTSRMLTHPLRV